MSRVEIVDQEYRLQAGDLGQTPRRVLITNVTMQGLETMAPTLHFAGEPKRLPLSREQSQALIEITGTAVTQQWIGATVYLVPTSSGSSPAIRILATPPKSRSGVQDDRRLPTPRAWVAALLVLAILITGIIALSSAIPPGLMEYLETVGLLPR